MNANTPNWQISIADTSQILTDGEDIAQCVYTILSTVKGSDPLRPTFGSDVYKYLDLPAHTANPKLMAEVYDALERWEKRITVNKCNRVISDIDKVTLKIEAVVIASASQVEMTITL